MCGILGYAGCPTDEAALWALVKALMVETKVRGKDGTGFYSLAGEDILYSKGLEPSDKFVLNDESFISLGKNLPGLFVGHCRAASVGPKIVRNCHPFVSKDDQLALVHNGTLRFFEKQLLGWFGRASDGETDSEKILRFMELFEEIPEAVERLFRVVLTGSQACVLVDSINSQVWLWRNRGRPLCYYDAREDLGVSFFFSTADIFVKAYKKAFTRQRAPSHMRSKIVSLKSDNLYRIDGEGGIFRREIRMLGEPLVWVPGLLPI